MVEIKIIDTHAHLDQIEDLEGALKRAEKIGIEIIVAVSTNLESTKRTLRISEVYRDKPKVLPALGIHPWNLRSEDIDSTMEFIEENLGRAVGLGEVGLDYWLRGLKRNEKLKLMQQEIFDKFIELSRRYRKPLLIHSRGAWRECLEMVRDNGIERAVFHWFSGSLTVLKELLEEGYYISASPAAEYSIYHQKAIRHAPIDRILLETDSPVKYHDIISEPAHLIKSLQAVAKLKSLDPEIIAEITTKNAVEIFGLKEPL